MRKKPKRDHEECEKLLSEAALLLRKAEAYLWHDADHQKDQKRRLADEITKFRIWISGGTTK